MWDRAVTSLVHASVGLHSNTLMSRHLRPCCVVHRMDSFITVREHVGLTQSAMMTTCRKVSTHIIHSKPFNLPSIRLRCAIHRRNALIFICNYEDLAQGATITKCQLGSLVKPGLSFHLILSHELVAKCMIAVEGYISFAYNIDAVHSTFANNGNSCMMSPFIAFSDLGCPIEHFRVLVDPGFFFRLI